MKKYFNVKEEYSEYNPPDDFEQFLLFPISTNVSFDLDHKYSLD